MGIKEILSEDKVVYNEIHRKRCLQVMLDYGFFVICETAGLCRT